MTECAIDWAAVDSGVKAISPVISWLLIILGWFFVSRDQNWRELRKEVRAAINEIVVSVRRIEEQSHQYLLKDGKDKEAIATAISLKRELKQLGGDLERLKVACPSIDCNTELIALRQIVTGRDFETRSREACSGDSMRLFEVSGAADELLNAVGAKFIREFHAGRWIPWWRRSGHRLNAK